MLAAKISGKVAVAQMRETNILYLSYLGPSPQLAADIANGVAEAYIEWSAEAKFDVVGLASEFLKTQIDQLKKELDAKQQQLLSYGRENDIISADPGTNASLQNLEALNRDYGSAVADRVAKEARYHELRTARPETIADTLSNGLVTSTRAELSKLERDYAEKLNLYKPEWPAMQQLKTQIDTSREHLQALIEETVTEGAGFREERLRDGRSPRRQPEGRVGAPAVGSSGLREQRGRVQQPPSRGRGEEDSSRRTSQTAGANGDHLPTARRACVERPDRGSRPSQPEALRSLVHQVHPAVRFRGRSARGRTCTLPVLHGSIAATRGGRLPAPSAPVSGGDSRALECFGEVLRVRREAPAQRHGRNGAPGGRAVAARAAPFAGGRGLPRAPHGPAAFARRRREVARGHLLRVGRGKEHDRGEPGRHSGAARQASSPGGRRSPPAAAARDLSRLEPDGPRFDPGGGSGVRACDRQDRDPRGLSRAFRSRLSEPLGPARVRRDVEVHGAGALELRLRDPGRTARRPRRGCRFSSEPRPTGP